MEPEIARRCPDCGASVRGSAYFCPQCGKKVKEGADTSSAGDTPPAPARRLTDVRTNAARSTREGPAAPDANAPSAVAESRGRAEGSSGRANNDDDGRSKRQRMTAAARDVVEEKLSPRVEKLRHASNVMLEEAAYDPSLRFVLVAIAILVLSLLLLLLNYLLG